MKQEQKKEMTVKQAFKEADSVILAVLQKLKPKLQKKEITLFRIREELVRACPNYMKKGRNRDIYEERLGILMNERWPVAKALLVFACSLALCLPAQAEEIDGKTAEILTAHQWVELPDGAKMPLLKLGKLNDKDFRLHYAQGLKEETKSLTDYEFRQKYGLTPVKFIPKPSLKERHLPIKKQHIRVYRSARKTRTGCCFFKPILETGGEIAQILWLFFR